jgi:glycerophosphoryl diester phosphodiesterase
VERRALFELQGHRGARGLKPENTLPSFEVALDLGVTSIETDLHLTRDGVPVLVHDSCLSEAFCRVVNDKTPFSLAEYPLLSALTLADLRRCRVDRNPDARRFPRQDPSVTPLAQRFADQHGFDPYTPPTLADLFAFAVAYAGQAGIAAGKSDAQRERAARLRFDLELKRVPFHPRLINDEYTGEAPARLEQQILAAVRAAHVVQRTTVRSFDHRCVRFLRQLEPALTGAVLMANTAPISPAELARSAEAGVYCPRFEFLDAAQVHEAHAAGVKVLPWTVNEPNDWQSLIDWGVDGITTDYPDRLGTWLGERGIAF